MNIGKILAAISAMLATTLESQANKTTLNSSTLDNSNEDNFEVNQVCELQPAQMLENTASLMSSMLHVDDNTIQTPVLDNIQTSSLVEHTSAKTLDQADSATTLDGSFQSATLDEIFQTAKTEIQNSEVSYNNAAQEDLTSEGHLIGADGAINVEVPNIHILDRSQEGVNIEVIHNSSFTSKGNTVIGGTAKADGSQNDLIANLNIKIDENAAQIDSQNTTIEDLIAAQNEALDNLANYDQRLADLIADNKNASAELKSELDALAQENANQLTTLQTNITALKAKLIDNETNILDLQDDVSDLTGDVTGLTGDVNGLKEDVTDLEADNVKIKQDASADKAELQAAIDALNIALTNAEERLSKAIEEGDANKNDDDDTTAPRVLFGTSDEDAFTAYDTNDTIYAMSGDDKIDGGLGADTLYGGEGIDLADYRQSAVAVDVNLEEGTGKYGHAEGDKYFELEGSIGSDFNDNLFGSSETDYLFGGKGTDTLTGNDGQDYLSGDQGADILDGGTNEAGVKNGDYADYTSSSQAIDVSLFEGEGFEGDAAGDTLTNIENVNGSLFDDYIEGDNTANLLSGNNGDDEIVGLGGNDLLFGGKGDDILSGDGGDDILTGGLGADLLEGGEGFDTADYSQASEGVLINMPFGGLGGEALGDEYDSIEAIQGSSFDDGIVGNNSDNTLFGGDGEDGLFGAGGNDTIIGGRGNDSLRGGEGNDLFVFEGEFDNDFISGFEGGKGASDQIQIKDEFVTSFEDVLEAMTTNGTDLVLTLEGGSITFEHTTADQLAADDFIFG